MTVLPDESFADVTDWVFDLDNTLYPAACNLFHQIDARMTSFIEGLLSLPYADARKIQKDLYVEHGTTLAGLMKAYNVDPHDFMEHVHDIDLSAIGPHQGLREVMASLPGRRFVHTNGSQKHAENVLGALGLEHRVTALIRCGFGQQAFQGAQHMALAGDEQVFGVHAVSPIGL